MFISYITVYPKFYETFETYTHRMNEGIISWYQFFKVLTFKKYIKNV